MRFDFTRQEFEALYDLASGGIVKSQRKLIEQFVKQFYGLRYPSKAQDKGGWAPIKPSIRSSWPSGHVKNESKPHWSFHKNNNQPKKKPTPKKLSADDVLAELT